MLFYARTWKRMLKIPDITQMKVKNALLEHVKLILFDMLKKLNAIFFDIDKKGFKLFNFL